MKIMLGKFKGRNFYRPEQIRPTQNVARKALFDLIGQDLSGLSFLDIFAGSGAIGLEAASCGAEKVVFIEKDPKCVQTIQDNLTLLDLTSYVKTGTGVKVIAGDAYATIKQLARKKEQFDIIFVDPPYGRGLAKKALNHLQAYDIVQPNCTLIIQHDKREDLSKETGRFSLFKQKSYGSTVLSIYHLGV